MTEAHTNGNLSVVIPMDDMELILTQMWKSRDTEPKMGELYKKYRELTTFEERTQNHRIMMKLCGT